MYHTCSNGLVALSSSEGNPTVTASSRKICQMGSPAPMGRHAADARDTCLAGTPDQIREQLHQLKSAGASTLFIPTLFRPLPELRRDLDRFAAEIAPAFR